jgi:hypothetical protein
MFGSYYTDFAIKFYNYTYYFTDCFISRIIDRYHIYSMYRFNVLFVCHIFGVLGFWGFGVLGLGFRV